MSTDKLDPDALYALLQRPDGLLDPDDPAFDPDERSAIDAGAALGPIDRDDLVNAGLAALGRRPRPPWSGLAVGMVLLGAAIAAVLVFRTPSTPAPRFDVAAFEGRAETMGAAEARAPESDLDGTLAITLRPAAGAFAERDVQAVVLAPGGAVPVPAFTRPDGTVLVRVPVRAVSAEPGPARLRLALGWVGEPIPEAEADAPGWQVVDLPFTVLPTEGAPR